MYSVWRLFIHNSVNQAGDVISPISICKSVNGGYVQFGLGLLLNIDLFIFHILYVSEETRASQRNIKCLHGNVK